MNKKVLHIGANKTGSTTLQRALFKNHSELYYVGEDGAGFKEYKYIVDSMVNDDELFFPEDECQNLFDYHIKNSKGKTFVYSNEDLMTSRIPKMAAKRLKSCLGVSSVLIVLRNQYTALPSFYASHGSFLKPAPKSYFRRHVQFEDWLNHGIMFPKYGGIASFFYSRILTIYEELFGQENIHILLFEDFINNQIEFVSKLSNILSIDSIESQSLLNNVCERPRISNRRFSYNKFRTNFLWGKDLSKVNPFGKHSLNMFEEYLDSGNPVKVHLSDKQRQRVYDIYAKDNTALMNKYDLPLKKYGYPIF